VLAQPPYLHAAHARQSKCGLEAPLVGLRRRAEVLVLGEAALGTQHPTVVIVLHTRRGGAGCGAPPATRPGTGQQFRR
jgi:hypothetical protein